MKIFLDATLKKDLSEQLYSEILRLDVECGYSVIVQFDIKDLRGAFFTETSVLVFMNLTWFSIIPSIQTSKTKCDLPIANEMFNKATWISK